MQIHLSPAAAERVRRHLERRGNGVGLRIGLKKSGCSGWTYAVDFADEIRGDDTVVEDQGVRVVIGSEHAAILEGARIDFVREGLNERFVFDNPNIGESCGCGESFTLP